MATTERHAQGERSGVGGSKKHVEVVPRGDSPAAVTCSHQVPGRARDDPLAKRRASRAEAIGSSAIQDELVGPRAPRRGPTVRAARRDSGRRPSGGRTARARRCRSAWSRPVDAARRAVYASQTLRAVSAQLELARRAVTPRRVHVGGEPRLVDHPANRRRQRPGILGLDEQPGIAEHLGQRAAVWRRRPAHRQSSPRAPECRSLPRTTAGRAGPRAFVERPPVRRVDVADVACTRPARGGRARRSSQGRASVVSRPASTSSGIVARPPTDGPDARRAAHTRRAACRRSCAARACRRTAVPVARRARSWASSGGAPGEHDGDAVGRHAQPALDLAGREPRRHDDGVRPVGMFGRERRIVAANLRARALRVREEVRDRES